MLTSKISKPARTYALEDTIIRTPQAVTTLADLNSRNALDEAPYHHR